MSPDTISLLADEHVRRAYVTALRSTGYDVLTVDQRFEYGGTDREIITGCRNDGRVVLTNDTDFVHLAVELDHAGVIMYQQYDHPPRSIVRAIGRIDRHLSTPEFENHVEWLENWL